MALEDVDILAIGICTVDLIATVPTFPQPDGRMDMRDFTQAVGGISAIASVTLARLGARTGFAGVVGDDAAGREIRATLDNEGVDTTLLSTHAGLHTPTTVIISDARTGTRSILNHPGIVTFALPASHDVAAAVERAAYVHLDYTAFPALADEILPRCRAVGTLVSLDAGVGFPGIERYLPLIDVYVTTDRQLTAMTGQRDLARGLAWVRAAGPRIVVATLGERGSVGLAGNNSVVMVPAFSVTVADTTGAGDVFHGAFLYALLHKQEMAAALTFANAAAALSCRAVGGHPGCPTLVEVQALCRDLLSA